MTKPFGMDELMARVRVALRRGIDADEHAVVRTEAFELDLAARQAVRFGPDDDRTTVKLTPTEWHPLDVLVRAPGRLVPQKELLRQV